jgi:hypothetical protein
MQIKLEQVTRRAQEQLQMVLEEQSRYMCSHIAVLSLKYITLCTLLFEHYIICLNVLTHMDEISVA